MMGIIEHFQDFGTYASIVSCHGIIVPYLPYPDGDGEDPEGPGAQDQRLSVSASG